MIIDARYVAIKNRLEELSNVELQRIIDCSDILCLDTFNYDERNETYCPLALALNLHMTDMNPTDESITRELFKRFNPVNVVRGLHGKFYTDNRKQELLDLCKYILIIRKNI